MFGYATHVVECRLITELHEYILKNISKNSVIRSIMLMRALFVNKIAETWHKLKWYIQRRDHWTHIMSTKSLWSFVCVHYSKIHQQNLSSRWLTHPPLLKISHFFHFIVHYFCMMFSILAALQCCSFTVIGANCCPLTCSICIMLCTALTLALQFST